jgi:integrase/recombinase XerD
VRLRDALDRFVVQWRANGRSELTIASFQRHVRVLDRWIASEGLSDDVAALDHETVARFLASPDARQSKGGGMKSPASLNILRSNIRTFLTYAHDAGWSATNPARMVRLARYTAPTPRGLSDHDRQRLMDALIVAQGPQARRDHFLFSLLLETGVRLTAALALTDRDVDIERSEITLRTNKNSAVHRVPMSRSIRDHAIGYLAERRSGPLFANRDGGRLSARQASRRLAMWLQRAGCQPVPCHQLRHAFGLKMYRRTRDLLVVQRALGHASITSTTIYAHADDAALRDAIDKV